jgi:MSHA biogenesis protein MshJ
MKKLNWQEIMKWLSKRHERERAILLVGGLGLLGMLWLTFVHDVLVAKQADVASSIAIAENTVVEERNRQNDIRTTYTTDPNVYAQQRQSELRDLANDANSRLNQLYGDLISPVQMTEALQTLLRSETTLDMVGFVNLSPEALIGGVTTPAEVDADDAAAPATAIPAVQVYKHGIHMVFEGSFLDTVYYLRSLEQLDSNFFWENLEFELTEYPKATISLDIYTLSTERGFLGV